MSSSLFNSFNPVPPQSPQSNQNFLTAFNQFRSTFNGDPRAQVMQLLSNGRMSQEQFNELAQTASQLRALIK